MSASHAPIDADAIIARMPPPRRRLLMAALATLRLTLNTQDTRQVALIEVALGGRAQRAMFRRFAGRPNGQAVIAERRSLVARLDDHAALRRLPDNSLGRRYLDFVEREGLSAQGLLDATPAATASLARLPDEVRIYCDYVQRGSHDLHHVLAGYGRDELGEICVLAMGYEQLRMPSYRIIATLGRFVVRRKLRRLGVSPHGVFAAVREAAAIGRLAAWIPDLDIEANLATDIDMLRAGLSIGTPVIYRDIIARLRQKHAHWQDGPLLAASRQALLF